MSEESSLNEKTVCLPDEVDYYELYKYFFTNHVGEKPDKIEHPKKIILDAEQVESALKDQGVENEYMQTAIDFACADQILEAGCDGYHLTTSGLVNYRMRKIVEHALSSN